MAAICVQKPEVAISSPWIEISYRSLVYKYFWPSELCDGTKPETGSSFLTSPPSWKINMTA